jgi:N-acetylglucosaminyl-diphospho-decaprenol L-rhamnosyltransferase
MTADVVVVSYNGGEHLLTCLEHLRAAARPGVRVIVADNASTDGSATTVRARFPDVTVLELPENAGFGRAVNAGAAAGDGEAIVLVNADMFVEPGFVEAIVAPFSDLAVGMVAGLSLVPGGELVDGFGIEIDAGLSAYNRLRLRPVGSAPGVLLGPSGGAAAYRRSAFEAAGGFDDAFFAYGEDVDLALRLRALGWRAAAAPEARGVHLGGASFGVGSPLQRRLGGFARGFLLRRYGVLRSRAAARALVVEALVVGWGLVRFRTLVPLTARVAGWRAAGGMRLAVPPDAVDRSITLREAIRRLARAR